MAKVKNDLFGQNTEVQFVNNIPDLMSWEDYDDAHEKKVVKFQIQVTDNGLEIIGDSPHPQVLEMLLAQLDPKIVEMMLCG